MSFKVKHTVTFNAKICSYFTHLISLRGAKNTENTGTGANTSKKPRGGKALLDELAGVKIPASLDRKSGAAFVPHFGIARIAPAAGEL